MNTILPFTLFVSLLAASAQAAPLVDKTLVAWVTPANLEQQGGGVLTLEDVADKFDAVVFGELAPGRWMAGSEMFARSQQDQGSWPKEHGGGDGMVQIAIVYRGKEVTLYRDGAEYARYAMPAEPHEFSTRSMVVMGKRHRHAGAPAFFAGEIDDARVYDHALSREEITALKPNEQGAEKPWAWWDFDASATEKTGRFEDTQLSGGAKVEGGRLVLDGADDYLLAKPGRPADWKPDVPARPANPPENWLTYHLAHPGPGEAMPGDPNCAFYWKGRYHLHYIYNNADGFSFAHVSSTDMVHWQWHPTTLTPPTTGHGMFSGTGFFTKEGRPAIIYHGEGSGRNQIQVALDDNLEQWSKPTALEPAIQPGQDASLIAHWDPDCWLDRDTYYALSGGSPGSGKPPTLFRSPDLQHWDYLGLFLSHDMPDVAASEDISCPNFFPIGSKWMLLCISHNKGCRYYLGDWKEEKFTPHFHARMNWKRPGQNENWGGDFFAPESLLTPDGRRVMWAWCILDTTGKQTGIQSLPRELSLPEDGVLRIKPLRELESLRGEEMKAKGFKLGPGQSAKLSIMGNCLELNLRFKAQGAKRFGVEVYSNSQAAGGFPIMVDMEKGVLQVGETEAPFAMKQGEDLQLRIFLDKGMVEVFANDRQAVVGYEAESTSPENIGITVVSDGGACTLSYAVAWEMKSPWHSAS